MESGQLKTRQVDLRLTGMTCSSCVSTIERSLNKLPGVRAAVNLAMESAHIIAAVNISEDELIAAVTNAGYQATIFKGERESFEKSNRLGVRLLLTLLLTAPIILISMVGGINKRVNKLLVDILPPSLLDKVIAPVTIWLSIALSVVVVLVLAWPIHRAAIKNLLNPTMDTLVCLGSLISLGWSIYSAATYVVKDKLMPSVYPEVSASVIFFVMLGRYLAVSYTHLTLPTIYSV